jgi:hypothetical protein
MKIPKDLKKIVKQYKAKGWTIESSGSGHAKWTSPVGDLVTTTSSTPSNGGLVAKKTATILRRYEKAVQA